jgi:hypothetical protein
MEGETVVAAPEVPAYYSKRAIWWFSVLFTVIFGAFLLFFNLRKEKKGQVGRAAIRVCLYRDGSLPDRQD